MEEILHQLADGLSHYNPIFLQCFMVNDIYQLVQDFFHPFPHLPVAYQIGNQSPNHHR
jgi:hypothetical protein